MEIGVITGASVAAVILAALVFYFCVYPCCYPPGRLTQMEQFAQQGEDCEFAL
jgi:hypothetical protein